MKGRAFDVHGNRWKSVERWPMNMDMKIDWLGFESTICSMIYCGWEVFIEINFFTKKKKVKMRHKDKCLYAHADYDERKPCQTLFIDSMTNQSKHKDQTVMLGEEKIYLSDLTTADILDFLIKINPVRRKTKSRVVNINDYFEDKNIEDRKELSKDRR